MTTFAKHAIVTLTTAATALIVPMLQTAATTVALAQEMGTSGYPPIGAPAAVTLLTAGAKPWTRVRYAIPKDYRAQVIQDIESESAVTMDGDVMPAPPTASMTKRATIVVTDLPATGDLTYAIAFTGFDTPNVTASAKNQSDYQSITGTARVDDRGITRAAQFDLSKTSNGQLAQLMANSWADLSTPLPEEPIGVGARWEAHQTIHTDGILAPQKTAYELIAIDGSVLTVKATVMQTALPQTMATPLMPSGSDARVRKYTGAGTGTITIRLDSLVPVRKSTLTSTMEMDVSAAGMTMEVTTSTTVRLAMRAVK